MTSTNSKSQKVSKKSYKYIVSLEKYNMLNSMSIVEMTLGTCVPCVSRRANRWWMASKV